jgi:hypothetical protein
LSKAPSCVETLGSGESFSLFFARSSRDHVEAIELRHLYIEEYQIGLLSPNCRDCFEPVLTFAHDLYVGGVG